MPSAHEYFSRQFEKWEKRGRGWQVFDQPVQPEPPFVPFRLRAMTDNPVVDDGCRPSFLGSLFRGVAPKPAPAVEPEPEEEPEPTPLIRDALVELRASLPEDFDSSNEAFGQLFHNLALCQEPMAFELVGIHKRVLVQFAASREDAPQVREQLSAHFPEVTFVPREGTLESVWDASAGDESFAVEFGLKQEFMLPLATGKLDPFIGLVGALAELQPGELGLFQVLWQPLQNPWAESIVHSVTHADGKPLFVNAPELTDAAENKVASPLFGVVVRILGRTASQPRLLGLARNLASALRVFTNPQGNALIPLLNDDYPFEDHIKDVLSRQSRRSGMILNSDELAGFVHLPSSAVRSPALLRDSGRTKAAPAIVRQPPGIVIGDNKHNDETVPVFLTADQRVRHTHIIGSNGTGKSSLLLNMIRQDIENGDGVAVLDPHGDLIDQILSFIPPERRDDVVLIDPSDRDFPIGFNILQAHSEDEKRLIASDLVSVFRRLATSWGDQMDMVLQNAILVFLESNRGGTLADLRRFLLEKAYRAEFLSTVQDPELIYYWQEVFKPQDGGRSIGSVLTRLQDFFSQKPLRNMVSQRDNKLDFADIMDSGKIFLAKLSEGLCGEENSYLLGTLLVSKFQQLAMARQAQKIEARRDFWLYIDEFQHFITPSMAKILTGTRKYRLGLTLAHQELHQLQSDAKVASAVMTQPCTRIVLRVGDDDAKKLGEGFVFFDAKSLARLEKFHAIVRVEQNDFDFNLALRKPETAENDPEQKDAIIAASRAKYATPRAEVEARLLASIRPDAGKIRPPEPPSAGSQPAPTPVSPSGPTTNLVQTASPAEKAIVPPPSPAAVIPQPAEPPKAAEVPKAARPVVPAESSGPPGLSAKEDQPKVVKDLGRGLALHKSIQKRIQAGAQQAGLLADIEKQLAAGSMKAADLVLQQGGRLIAVEIAISPSVSHEFENVKKCLEAGFNQVVVIATGRKRLDEIAAAVQSGLGAQAAAKVSYHIPDEFLLELQKMAKAAPAAPPLAPLSKTGKALGYVIEREFPQQSPEEQRLRQQAVHEITKKALE